MRERADLQEPQAVLEAAESLVHVENGIRAQFGQCGAVQVDDRLFVAEVKGAQIRMVQIDRKMTGGWRDNLNINLWINR